MKTQEVSATPTD